MAATEIQAWFSDGPGAKERAADLGALIDSAVDGLGPDIETSPGEVRVVVHTQTDADDAEDTVAALLAAESLHWLVIRHR